jgi:glutathione S-transferase
VVFASCAQTNDVQRTPRLSATRATRPSRQGRGALNAEAYRQLSPFEQIPAIDDDGLVLSESAAILGYPAKKSHRDFVATKGFTVADILMAHVLSAGIKDEGSIAPYPRIAPYRDRCLARPAWLADHRGVLRAGRGGIDERAARPPMSSGYAHARVGARAT